MMRALPAFRYSRAVPMTSPGGSSTAPGPLSWPVLAALLLMLLAVPSHASVSFDVLVSASQVEQGAPGPTVSVSASNQGPSRRVDVHLVVKAPDGAYYAYPDWNTRFRPWLPNYLLPSDFQLSKMKVVTLPELPWAGTYEVIAALTAPGTLDIVSIASRKFQVVNSSLESLGGIYAFDTEPLRFGCSDGSSGVDGTLHYYINADVSGNDVVFSRDFIPAVPGFEVDYSSGINGSVSGSKGFFASGYAVMSATGLGQVVVNYHMDGQFTDGAWFGDYYYTLSFSDGSSCEFQTAFSGKKGGPKGVGGIWRGIAQNGWGESIEILALSTESGEVRFLSSDWEQSVGTFTVDGRNLQATVFSYAPVGYYYPNGSTYVAGNLSATLIPRSRVNGSAFVQGQKVSTFSLYYDQSYEKTFSLAALAGSYSTWDAAGGYTTYYIDGAGRITGYNSIGCSYRGDIAVIDRRFNLYRMDLSLSGCGVLNGEFSGLAALLGAGGAANNLLTYSMTGPQWILSGSAGRNY